MQYRWSIDTSSIKHRTRHDRITPSSWRGFSIPHLFFKKEISEKGFPLFSLNRFKRPYDDIWGNGFCPHPPPSNHFPRKSPFTDDVSNQEAVHAFKMPCLECELPNLLLESMSPDQDLVDLIEQAFIEGQIDSQKVGLVHLWMHASSLSWAEQRENDVVLFVVLFVVLMNLLSYFYYIYQ